MTFKPGDVFTIEGHYAPHVMRSWRAKNAWRRRRHQKLLALPHVAPGVLQRFVVTATVTSK